MFIEPLYNLMFPESKELHIILSFFELYQFRNTQMILQGCKSAVVLWFSFGFTLHYIKLLFKKSERNVHYRSLWRSCQVSLLTSHFVCSSTVIRFDLFPQNTLISHLLSTTTLLPNSQEPSRAEMKAVCLWFSDEDKPKHSRMQKRLHLPYSISERNYTEEKKAQWKLDHCETAW